MEEEIPDVMVDEEIPFSEGDLLEMVQELPSGYRMVFNLFAIEGYKHEEIAEMLGCSVGTSRSQYFKAKKSLKKRIVEKYKQDEI
jgi:RNA polymerase sigma-70 factor (ECF subfamily)